MLYPKAYWDIEDIYEYIAITKSAPQNAKGQTDRIWDAIKGLEKLPQSRQNHMEGRYAGSNYKQLIIDNYIAIFKIDETSKTVYVITVQYQGRNI